MRFVFVLMLLAGPSLMAQDMSGVEIKTVKINDHLSMLVGAGGNIGVCGGEDGVFMIDDQFAPLTDKIAKAVKDLHNDTVKFVINTHWHYDHTGGNENFGKAGSIIVAHENVRKRMSKGQFMEDFNREVPPAPKGALPVITFTRDMTFHLNNEEIFVYHVSKAHTDGDSIIHFKTSNVLHMGDCYFNGLYPFIDVGSGGDVNGVIRVAKETLDMIDENTKIIPGHGPLAKKADLQNYHDMLVSIRDNIKNLIDSGKSLEEVLAAKPTARFDDPWGKAFLQPDKFATIVYNSLTKNK